ncbi:MAG: serine/threonine-protein kinase [Candidatus Limnocylindria bacterium]
MSGSGPRTIGNFAIERELAAGGMGVVLLGRHGSLDRLAVLKRLRPELAASDELVERFAREARAAAAVHHQNVVAVYDWISWRGEHYIAQEYVDGADLRAALHELGSVPWRVAALIGLELARGLEAIHACGTVHRDLKPANVLLGRNGDVKIADFGIAIGASNDGLTRPGTTIGTPPYVAPEQILGERVDARGDLFALGVVLYELLAGAPPFREPVEGEKDSLLQRIQRGRYTRVRTAAPLAPRWLARLIQSLLRAKPRARPGSAQQIRQLLERKLAAFPTDAKLELASFLWTEAVFQPRAGDTVVLSARAPEGSGRRRLRHLALAAGLAGALALFAYTNLDRARLPELARQARAILALTPDDAAAPLGEATAR